MATYGPLSGRQNTSPYVSTTQPSMDTKPRKCCGFSARFIHYFLFIFNFIFLLSGLLILVLTIAYGRPRVDIGETHLRAIQALIPSTHLVNLVHYAMVLCGTAICLIALINAFIGCCGHSSDTSVDDSIEMQSEIPLTSGRPAVRDRYNNNSSAAPLTANRVHRKPKPKRDSNSSSMVLCFFIFGLLFLFTLQLIIGLVSFISVTPNADGKDEFMSSLTENLNTSELLVVHKSQLESLYGTFKCCGWTFYDNYEINNKSSAVPDACCKTVVDDCGQRKHPSNIYYDGCVIRFGPILKEYLLILGSVALGFSIIEVFGLIFSCCLYVQLASD